MAKLVVGSAWSTLVPPGRRTEHRITSALLSSSLLPRALGHLWSRRDLPMALYLEVGYSSFWDNKVGFFSSFTCFFPSKSEPYHDICNDWSQMCRLTDKTVKITLPQHVWGTQTRYNICRWFCKIQFQKFHIKHTKKSMGQLLHRNFSILALCTSFPDSFLFMELRHA